MALPKNSTLVFAVKQHRLRISSRLDNASQATLAVWAQNQLTLANPIHNLPIMLRNLLYLAAVITLAFTPAKADQRDFHDQDLKEKDFSQGVLNGANFSDAILKNCKFSGASLKKANFKGADLTGAWLTDADLTGADLSETKGNPLCSHSHFDRANLKGIDLKANDCTFKGANLNGCKISGYIYNCDFSGADLRGVNMRAMTVTAGGSDSNRWKGALYDDDTAWPDGFNPEAVGAILSKSPEK